MQRLMSVFKVRPEEGQLVLLVGVLFLCIQAGQGMGDNAASALFFLRFGVDFLPYMYLILGAATFLLTLAYSAGLGRFERRRFFQALVLGLAVLLLLEWTALKTAWPLLYPILWLTVSCMGMILGTFTWQLAGEVSDARQAKRLFPLFTSAGILGSVLGNSVTGAIARLLGTDNLLLFYAVLLGLAYFLTRLITKRYFRPAKPADKTASLLSDLRSGFDFVRGSPLMQLIAYASILFSILFFAIAFPFNKVVTASFPDEASVAGFLGLFSSITTAVTFLVSLFLASRIYTRLGIVNSVLLMPLVYLFGFIVFASSYSLNGAVVARFAQLVVLGGIAGTAWNALFNVIPSQKRGQVLAFQNGVPSQIGVALSGVMLILGERMLTATQIFLIGISVTLVCGFLVWRMRLAYGQALVAALRLGRLEVFSSDEPAFAGLQGDAAALSVVTSALEDAKPATRRLAAEILGKMQNAAAVPALTHQISDPEAEVRAAALGALGELRAASALDSILAGLDDREAEVRAQALAALTQLEPESSPDLLEKLARLLDDVSVKVRTRSAVILSKLGEGERALSSLRSWLQDEDLSLRVAALETFGRMAMYLVGGLEPAPVLLALQDSSVPIREAACKALAGFKDALAMGALVACLHDPQSSVRAAAAESLRLHGPDNRALILKVLESGDDSLACDSALDALSPEDAQASEPLRFYARREIARLRALRAQAAGLPKEAGALALLRETLEDQIQLGESRLVKIVGLIGNAHTMELVRKSIGGSDVEGRAAALEALETLGDKGLARDILALLEEEPRRSDLSAMMETILKSGDRWTRALGIRAIQELGLRGFISRLDDLNSDPDGLVREAALEALIRFGEVKSMDTLQTVSTLGRVLLLREIPIFAELSPEDLKQVAEIAREQWYPGGTTICREGDEGNIMFVIVSGRVHVIHSTNGQDQVLAQRGPGDFVGEGAIIESAPRSATLVAQDEVRMLAIEGEAFKRILRERPEVSLAVMRSLSRRLREMIR
jgi:HEAT repeat protein